MEYYALDKAAFEAEYFEKGVVRAEEAQWRHWPASAALFLGDFPGAVRCAPLGLLGCSYTEGPFLHLIQGDEQRRGKGEPARARVLCQVATGAVVGLAAWDWDTLWPSTCVVDLYCYPGFREDGWALLGELALPAAERCGAYNDAECRQKRYALLTAGFRPVGLKPRWVAPDRARTRLLDVEVGEKA
ncbi:MAG: hypothetical protein FJY95_05995 [Candidatus Handelsmanbacteria bacterium]|nr:hypothetical protein [Candidatus Handelsmanbacteria bacterium]